MCAQAKLLHLMRQKSAHWSVSMPSEIWPKQKFFKVFPPDFEDLKDNVAGAKTDYSCFSNLPRSSVTLKICAILLGFDCPSSPPYDRFSRLILLEKIVLSSLPWLSDCVTGLPKNIFLPVLPELFSTLWSMSVTGLPYNEYTKTKRTFIHSFIYSFTISVTGGNPIAFLAYARDWVSYLTARHKITLLWTIKISDVLAALDGTVTITTPTGQLQDAYRERIFCIGIIIHKNG